MLCARYQSHTAPALPVAIFSAIAWPKTLALFVGVLRRIPKLTSLLFPQPIRKGQREVYAGLGSRPF